MAVLESAARILPITIPSCETQHLCSGAPWIGDSITPVDAPVTPTPSKCISVIFSAGPSPSCNAAESEDSIRSRTCIFAPWSCLLPSHPDVMTTVLTSDCEGPSGSMRKCSGRTYSSIGFIPKFHCCDKTGLDGE